jgi:hypothetical protein
MIPVFLESRFYMLTQQGEVVLTIRETKEPGIECLDPEGPADPWQIAARGRAYLVYPGGRVREVKPVRSEPMAAEYWWGFSEGVAVASTVARNWGMGPELGACVGAISTEGEWVIPPKFDAVEPFVNGACLAEDIDNKQTVFAYDLRGQVLARHEGLWLDTESSTPSKRDPRCFFAMATVRGTWRPVLVQGDVRRSVPYTGYVEYCDKSVASLILSESDRGPRRCRLYSMSGQPRGKRYFSIWPFGDELYLGRSSDLKRSDILHASGRRLFTSPPEWIDFKDGFFLAEVEGASTILDWNGEVVASARVGRLYLKRKGFFLWMDVPVPMQGARGAKSAILFDNRLNEVWRSPEAPARVLR